MRCCLLLTLCCALTGVSAALCDRARAQDIEGASQPAESAVLLLEAPGLRPALCAALRIQLAGLAQVRCVPTADTSDLATRIELASRTLAQDDGSLAVLLERDPSPARVRMVLVGREPDQAVLAIESIEDRPAPDVDRSLALKVRDTLETMSAAAAVEQQAPSRMSLARTLAPRQRAAELAQPAVAAEPASTPTLHLLLEAGAGARVSNELRATGQLALGARASRDALYGELVLQGQLASSLRASTELGRVIADEWSLTLGLRGGRSIGRVGVGVVGELALVRATALGVARDGSSDGERSLSFARLGLGLDLRVLLMEGPASLSLRFAPTVHVDPVALRFELDGQSVLSPGRAAAYLPFSLLVELPVRRTRTPS